MARMAWTVTNKYSDANHHPVAVIGNDKSRRTIIVSAKAGKEICLNAENSFDPDDNPLSFVWQFYKEPSSYKGNLLLESHNTEKTRILIPGEARGKTIHIILKVSDNALPNLCSYRRIVINVKG